MTNADLIRDALSLLGVVGETDTLSAEQGSHRLRQLNEMLAEWEADGLDLAYFEQDDINDESPIQNSEAGAVKYNLAIDLAPHYGKSVSEELAARAGKYLYRLKRDQMVATIEPADVTHLPLGEAHWIWKDIAE